jgi:sugar phosphate isomerase/epimerase
MVTFGFNARSSIGHSWSDEVIFAKKNDFNFLQLYCDGSTELSSLREQKEQIKNASFPLVIHAALDITEIKQYLGELIAALKYLELSELIIHPSNENGLVIDDLSREISIACEVLKKERIGLYLENNSRKHPIFHSPKEVELIFGENKNLRFLLDLAHIDDYNHLLKMVKIKKPEILHIADRHLEVIHEHLPVGDGNIDFGKVFKEIIPSYNGRIIFEIRSDEGLIHSKKIISQLINMEEER